MLHASRPRVARSGSQRARRRGWWLLPALAAACAGVAAQKPEPQTRLFAMLNAFRAESGLQPIQRSPNLGLVAQRHAEDLELNPPAAHCSPHSWSTRSPGSSCCYPRDHSQPRCMWDKPREITGRAYPGLGFEIVCHHPRRMTPEIAMDCWKASGPHLEVILNRGRWNGIAWKALGVEISEHYAIAWFGRETDRASKPRSLGPFTDAPAAE